MIEPVLIKEPAYPHFTLQGQLEEVGCAVRELRTELAYAIAPWLRPGDIHVHVQLDTREVAGAVIRGTRS